MTGALVDVHRRGSERLARMRPGAAFPGVEVVTPEPPFDLAELAPAIDLAVVGAGMTDL